MNKVAWVTLTNGRKEYFEQARPSWYSKMQGNITEELIVDTSGIPEYAEWLKKKYPNAKVISQYCKGYSRSVKFFMDQCLLLDCDYIFHLEDDYVLDVEINLEDSIKIINDNDHIKQVHFIRQAWTEVELEFGSVLKHCKSLGFEMIEKNNGSSDWVEHNAYFTFGPTIYKKEIACADWDLDKDPEREFTRIYLSGNNKTATFGKFEDNNIVTHIGMYTLGEK